MDATLIRQGELVGRGVMAYETTEEVGLVEYLLVDMQQALVVGLACKAAGLLSRRQHLSWSQQVKIGRDRIVVHTEPDPPGTAEAAFAAAQNVTGLEVWTDGGDAIGQVVDFCFDPATGQIARYLFTLNVSEERLAETPAAQPFPAQPPAEPAEPVDPAETAPRTDTRAYCLNPNAIISAGRKRLMIAEEDAQRSQPYDQPLDLAVPAASNPSVNWRPEQLPEIPADLGELVQGAQSLAGKVTERVRRQAKHFADEQRTEQGAGQSDELPDITEQLQAKTEQVKQQMQAQFEKAKAKAQDLEQDLEDRFGETAWGRSLGQRVNQTVNQTLGRFKQSPDADRRDPIDIEAFEVWEDDD